MNVTESPGAEASAPDVLALQGFGMAYGERTILEGLDLRLPARGLTVLLGPSGTGKSSLLRSLSGHNDQHASFRRWGHSVYLGTAIDEATQRPPLAVQKPQLLIATLLENLVTDWPERARLTPAEQVEHLGAWLAGLGLEDMVARLRCPVVELPKGEQRLVALLRVLLLDAPLVLVDEPTAGLTAEQAEPILTLLQRQAHERALLVVMHHIEQSRRIGDHVLVLASGAAQEFTDGSTYFDAPRSKAGELLLRTGTCPEDAVGTVPTEPPVVVEDYREPDIDPVFGPRGEPTAPKPYRQSQRVRTDIKGPNGFEWLFPGQLAGTPWPGLVQPADYDLSLLQSIGVTRLLSLTESPFDAMTAQPYGIVVTSLPIEDMAAPGVDETLTLCRDIDRWLSAGETVAAHCRAGLGRTGTILAAYWLWRARPGTTGAQALKAIRRCHRGWVQSEMQIHFLDAFAQVVAKVRQGVSHEPLSHTTDAVVTS